METYKYSVKISESGTIQIPYHPALMDKEVEIIIMPKPEPSGEKMKGSEFVDKWAGFLSVVDTKKAKLDYLLNKHK